MNKWRNSIWYLHPFFICHSRMLQAIGLVWSNSKSFSRWSLYFRSKSTHHNSYYCVWKLSVYDIQSIMSNFIKWWWQVIIIMGNKCCKSYMNRDALYISVMFLMSLNISLSLVCSPKQLRDTKSISISPIKKNMFHITNTILFSPPFFLLPLFLIGCGSKNTETCLMFSTFSHPLLVSPFSRIKWAPLPPTKPSV